MFSSGFMDEVKENGKRPLWEVEYEKPMRT
jgi:hypothetical protein